MTVKLWLLSSVLVGVSVLSASVHADPESELKTTLERVTAKGAVTSIKESPYKGVYEVNLGGQIRYAQQQGDLVLIGDVYDTKRKVSLSDEAAEISTRETLAAMDESDMVVFAGKNPEHTITVFTDIDCGYCQKLHRDVPELVENGVKVRYLFFPRSGLDTPSYDKAVSVWCADDQISAMDNAKNSRVIDDKTCINPVADQFNSGVALGVQGTPTIYLESGRKLGGYVPAEQLLQLLNDS